MADVKEYEKLRRSLTGFKAAFTRIEGVNERLVEYAPAVASPQTVSELEKALSKIETQYDRLNQCVDELSALSIDDDELEDYRGFQAKVCDRYEKNRSLILDAIKVVGVPAREPIQTARGTGGGAGRLNINKSLKPFTLLATHNPTEFKNWARQFKAYYRSSNMDVLEVPDQQIYLQSCIEPTLFAKISGKLDDTTEMFGIDDGCLALLVKDFEERWPIFNRRLAFFRSAQQSGQETSTWFNELEELSLEADISELTTEEILVFRILCGMSNHKIRHELTKMKTPTLKDYKEKIVEMEISRRMESSLDTTRTAKAAAVKQKSGSRNQTNKQSGLSKAEYNKSMQGRCYRCGSKDHTRRDCPRTDLVCHACGVQGHQSNVCYKKLTGALQGESKAPAGRKAQAAKVQSTAEAKSDQADSDAEEKEEAERVTVLKHKIFCVKTHVAMTIANPTPKIKVILKGKNGTPFKFRALPDTGCTTTVMSEDISKAHGLRIKPCTDKLIAADDSELDCRGEAELWIDEVKTRALVSNSLKNEVIIGWPDLKRLGIISPNFPERQKTQGVNSISNPVDQLETVKQKFSDILTDVLPEDAMKGPQMKINLRPNAKPRRVTTTKAIPLHWQAEADKTLKKLLADGIIEPVPIDEPSEWVSPAFFVEKEGGKAGLRLVTDFSHLNKFVRRPIHPFPSAMDIMQAIPGGSTVFAKLDAVQGYHQIPLDPESRALTTFLLPSGRYRYKRGPMGLCSTNDEWCGRSDVVIKDIPGCFKIVDDILIAAKNYKELFEKIELVLSRCRDAKLTVSLRKLKVGKRIPFAGYIVSANGVEADPDKTTAITAFPKPKCVKDIRSFLGMVNQLGCFLSDLAMITAPLRHLLKKDTAWIWTEEQEEAFNKIKQVLVSPTIMQFYDPTLPTILLTDASKLYGLGYALVQKKPDETLSLVQCGSRSLTSAESRYAPIESECLAIQWAIMKARHYLIGHPGFEVVTDHNPLVGLFTKSLAEIDNRRLQRLRGKLVDYNFEVKWVEGKSHMIADAFSRYPVEHPQDSTTAVIAMIQVEDQDLKKFTDLCYQNDTYKELVLAVESKELKDLKNLPPGHIAQSYLCCWNNLSTSKEGNQTLVTYNSDRLVVPTALRTDILTKLHSTAHSGVTKMKRLAQETIFWPGITKDIMKFVEECGPCRELQPKQSTEPLEVNVARFPMKELSCDLFQWNGSDYLVIVDRFSGFLWGKMLRKTRTDNVTKILQTIFHDFGYPQVIQTDNGPQFRGPFGQFCKEFGITHVTSSPYNPTSNGLAESGVKICKSLLTKSKLSQENFDNALGAWRNTPRADGLAPSDLLFGFRQRQPGRATLRKPEFIERGGFSLDKEERRKKEYSKRGGTPLVPLEAGSTVLVQSPSGWTEKAVIDAVRPSGRSPVHDAMLYSSE